MGPLGITYGKSRITAIKHLCIPGRESTLYGTTMRFLVTRAKYDELADPIEGSPDLEYTAGTSLGFVFATAGGIWT
jgi:hypothetical protein